MNELLFFLQRNSQPIVIFFACLTCIFVVIRPFSMGMVEYFHRRRIAEAEKLADAGPQPLDREMEALFVKAAAMGVTDLERLRRLARNNPDRAKDMIRNWIYGEDSSPRQRNASSQ